MEYSIEYELSGVDIACVKTKDKPTTQVKHLDDGTSFRIVIGQNSEEISEKLKELREDDVKQGRVFHLSYMITNSELATLRQGTEIECELTPFEHHSSIDVCLSPSIKTQKKIQNRIEEL